MTGSNNRTAAASRQLEVVGVVAVDTQAPARYSSCAVELPAATSSRTAPSAGTCEDESRPSSTLKAASASG